MATMTPDSSGSSSSTTTPHWSDDGRNATTADGKVMADLAILKEKLDLCESLLPTSTASDDGFLGVVGFLEACQPRVVELVQVAATGALGEAVLMECLSVNDRLATTLVQTDAKLPPVAASTPPVAAIITPTVTEDDLLFQVTDDNASTPSSLPPPANAKTTGEEQDPFGNDLKTTPSNDEEFDDFFSERTASKQG